MLRYARHVPRSEEIVMAPATAQLVQLTISSELARKQNIPVPDMVPAVEIVVEAGRSFTMAAEEEAARLSPECARQVRTLTKDLDMAGSDLMSVAVALRKDQSVALRTALRDACFSYNLVVMKVLLSLDGQKTKIIGNCGEQLIAEIHSIPQTGGNMKTLVPLFKHFIEDLTQFCYRATDYHKELKDKVARNSIQESLKILKKTPTVLSNILQDKTRRSRINTDPVLHNNIKTFVKTVQVVLDALNSVDIDSATHYLELVLHASIAVAGERSPRRRTAVMSYCAKIINIRSELAKLFMVTTQSSQPWSTINTLTTDMSEAFSELNRILSQTYKSDTTKVEHSQPLKNLKHAAEKEYMMDDDPELDKFIDSFKKHANRLIDITEYAVEVTSEEDDVEALRLIAGDISVLCPRIIASALSVAAHPGQNMTQAYLNIMCEEWSKTIAKLLRIIDQLTNSGEFMKASEDCMDIDMAISRQAFSDQDAAALQKSAKAMINRAQRVFHVGQKELLKSVNGTFSTHLEGALVNLENLIPIMITCTDMALANFGDISAQEELAHSAQDIARAVHRVKTIVCEFQGDEISTQVDAAKRLASALRGDTGYLDIGIQCVPGAEGRRESNVLLQFAMSDQDTLENADINNLIGLQGIRKPPASIQDAIVTLADVITTAMNGEPVESSITILAAHCGRIKDLSQKCHTLTDNETRLRTIDFLVQEMNKLTPSVNDAARMTMLSPSNASSIENLRWSARHWADSVIVLGKAFDDFGLGPAPATPRKKAPSVNGLLSAATSGDGEMTEAELDSLCLRTSKEIQLAEYCSEAILSSTIAQEIDSTIERLDNMVTEVSRTARALALSSDDDVTESHLVHVCSEWQELYQKLADLVADNQPSALPDENEMGIPPSQVNVAFEQLSNAAKYGARARVQILGNTLSAMATKMRRLSKPFLSSVQCEDYQREYITEMSEEILHLTPEVIECGLIVAADPNNAEHLNKLQDFGSEWVDKMVSLSNALEMEEGGAEVDGASVMSYRESVTGSVREDVKEDVTEEVLTCPEDLQHPLNAAGFRLLRLQVTGMVRRISTDGRELKEVKGVTTKLCDCLQVLSTTHEDVNIRYEMEDNISEVKSTVNNLLMKSVSEGNVREWDECINNVISHLNTFLQPILDIVSGPGDDEVFRVAIQNVNELVEGLMQATNGLQEAVKDGLITEEKEVQDVTLVTLTQAHVTKMTPLMCDAIRVVTSRPNDALQRTKFEAIKYQWASKFKLLCIATDDIIGNIHQFPPYGDRHIPLLEETCQTLINCVTDLQCLIDKEVYCDIIWLQKAVLQSCVENMSYQSYTQYLKTKFRSNFALYCLRCAILHTSSHLHSKIPDLISLMDSDNLSFDLVKYTDHVDSAIDIIQKQSDRIAAEIADIAARSQYHLTTSSVIETLVMLSDEPSPGLLAEYSISYYRWLTSSVLVVRGAELRGVEVAGPQGRWVSEVSLGATTSQTFSELHFSDTDHNTPEPTMPNGLHTGSDNGLSSEGESDKENNSFLANSDNQNLRYGTDDEDLLEPLEMEYTEDPSQTAQVSRQGSEVSPQLAAVDPCNDDTPSFITSIECLEDELEPWLHTDNALLVGVANVTDVLRNLRQIVNDGSSKASTLALAVSLISDCEALSEDTLLVSTQCTHKACAADLQCCSESLPILARELHTAATQGGGSLTGAVHSISQCMITLLHSAHHAHLAGAVREGPLWCSAEGSDSDDSVLI